MEAAGLQGTAGLACVRRLEAAGFRAWPAASVQYDGAWLIRLTPGMSAKRLNSINPLDPGDSRDLPERIARAEALFRSHGLRPVFRLSPLAGSTLPGELEARGWGAFDPSAVMTVRLDRLPVADSSVFPPVGDLDRYVSASLALGGLPEAKRTGLTALIAAIEGKAGLFVLEQDGQPAAAGVCVHHGEVAGIFEITTRADLRGQGLGRRLVLGALQWARQRGARLGWLQVGSDNAAARGLYHALGFADAYAYHYRRAPGP